MPSIASPPHLPIPLYTQKILTGLEHKNGEIKPKSRRRWGLVSRSTKDSDDWADLDDSDFSPSFTRIDLKNKKRQSDESLCRQAWAPICALTASGFVRLSSHPMRCPACADQNLLLPVQI